MTDELTNRVKALALEVGFSRVGIAPAGEVPHGSGLLAWLEGGRHGPMEYMAKNLSLRLDPSRLVPGAKSVICLAVAYRSTGETPVVHMGKMPMPHGRIARFAGGRDYHKVLKSACIKLMDAIRSWQVGFEGRAFVDSGPVMERSLAAMAGLGWIGRNGCLIVPGLGSYVLLCEIICNLPLCPDGPMEGSCGRCGQCVKSCPMGAMMEDGMVDANRCISCLTIENRGEIAPEYWPRMGTRIFGCDTCQEACPHNAGSTDAPALPLAEVLRWEQGDWDAATRGLAIRRATWPMFLRNAAIAAGNSRDKALLAPLKELRLRAEGDLAFLRPLIDWAMSRLD
jgi:epoxyqueuosine reductase